MSGFPIAEPGNGSKRQNEVEDRAPTGHGDDHKQNEVEDRAPTGHEDDHKQNEAGDSAPTGHEDDHKQTEVGGRTPTLNQQGTVLHVLVKNGRRYITCDCNGSKKCQFCDGVVVPPADARLCKLDPHLARVISAIVIDIGLLAEEPTNNVDAVVTVTGTRDMLNALLRLLSPLFVRPICSYPHDKESNDHGDDGGFYHREDDDCFEDEDCGVCEDCIRQEEWTEWFQFDNPESVCERNRFHVRYGNSRFILETVSPVSFTGVMQGFVNGALCRYQSIFTRPHQQTFLRMEQSTLPATPAELLPTNNPRGLHEQFRRLERYFEFAIRSSMSTGNPLTENYWAGEQTRFVGGTLARFAVQREFCKILGTTVGLGEIPTALLDCIMSYLCPASCIDVSSECHKCMSRHATEISFVFSCCGAHFCMECVARRLRRCIGLGRLATCTVYEYAELLENLQCSAECEPEFDEVGMQAPCRNYWCGHERCDRIRDQEEELRERMRSENEARWFDERESDSEFDENAI